MRHQNTLCEAITLSGIGLHTGRPVRACLHPAAPDTGVVFRSGDDPTLPVIPALHTHVHSTLLATTLSNGAWSVSTVEHLLAALWASGVSNVVVEIHGGEVPVLDGSAMLWQSALSSAGLQAQGAMRRCLRVTAPIEVRDGPRWSRLTPSDTLHVSAHIAFDHGLLQEQFFSLALTPAGFQEELSWARTFGLLSDVEAMRAAGLAQGGSLENAVVYGPDGVLNPEGLRSPDEAVRHKMLDMVGDLALSGVDVCGHFESHLPGHALNLSLVQALLSTPSRWVLEE